MSGFEEISADKVLLKSDYFFVIADKFPVSPGHMLIISNEIRKDATFEDQFLQMYACPRCNESFQKKPWITIRDCFKCKTKYR
jgi:ATP adenylyltransferase/5',5'''-P-1,P-4-tetraphosphate phosphorylase II